MKRLFNFDRSNISKELKIIQMEFLPSITKFYYSSLFLQLTSKYLKLLPNYTSDSFLPYMFFDF